MKVLLLLLMPNVVVASIQKLCQGVKPSDFYFYLRIC